MNPKMHRLALDPGLARQRQGQSHEIAHPVHSSTGTDSSETLWQLTAGQHAVIFTCRVDIHGIARVVEVPDLLHYMKGWLVDDVSRYARNWGWRLQFVA